MSDETMGPELGDGMEEDAFFAILESVAGSEDARIDVYRRRPPAGWVGVLHPSEFSLPELRRSFGGGKFDLRLVQGGKYQKGKTVDIAGPPKDFDREPLDQDARREADVARRAADARTLPAPELGELIRAELRGMLHELRNPPPQAEQANPLAMTLELVKNFQSLIQPYMEGMGGRGRGRGDMDVMEAIRFGMELAGERSAPQEDPYAGVLRMFGPAITQALASGGNLPALNPGAQDPQEPQPMEPQEPHNALDALRPWIPTLVNWAVSGRDPGVRADFIVDELPRRYNDMLAAFMGNGDAITVFLTKFPDAVPHRVWFEELFAALRVAYGLDDGDDGDTEEDDDESGDAELGGPGSR